MTRRVRTIVAFLRAVAVGTYHRLRSVPPIVVCILRRLARRRPPPIPPNPHYAELERIAALDRPLAIDDVEYVVVPLLLERGREIAAVRAELARAELRMQFLYLLLGALLVAGAYAGQQLIGGTRQAVRVNCLVISNLVAQSGSDGRPSPAAELNGELVAAIVAAASPQRRARIRSLQTEARRSGALIQRPDCDEIVAHPEDVHAVTFPAPAARAKPPPAGRRSP